MKKTLLAAVSAVAALATVSAAQAAGGCGVGFHRGPYGGCRANGAVVAVGPLALRIGGFYPGHGYWDGHRYWAHRYRWHGGWRYR
jgi:opacity protein-like surface antigen